MLLQCVPNSPFHRLFLLTRIQAYRTFLIWQGNWKVIVLPTLLLIAGSGKSPHSRSETEAHYFHDSIWILCLRSLSHREL